jgi:hypothetical protein
VDLKKSYAKLERRFGREMAKKVIELPVQPEFYVQINHLLMQAYDIGYSEGYTDRSGRSDLV